MGVQDVVELLHDQLDPTMRQLHDLKEETKALWEVLRRICSDKLLDLERDLEQESTKPIAVKSLGAPSRTLLVDRFKMDIMIFFRLSGQLENEDGMDDVPEGEKLAETFKVKIVDGDVAGYEV